jgi:hypothetical protein
MLLVRMFMRVSPWEPVVSGCAAIGLFMETPLGLSYSFQEKDFLARNT